MWKQFTEAGMLAYPNFLETVNQIKPMYMIRALGGLLYLSGVFIMVYNLIKTANAGKFLANEEAQAAPLAKEYKPHGNEPWHRRVFERAPLKMALIALIVVSIGGLIEIVPTYLVDSNIPTIASVKPYTPLELHGRDIYIREGCNNCHSQMVRPFRSETERYGEYAKAGEFVYDHPFLWGSRRTGPDLLRLGGKYPDSWHYHHMLEPESMSPGSIMPPYPWLFEDDTDYSLTEAKIGAMRTLGVPYEEGYESQAMTDIESQSSSIASSLAGDGIKVSKDKEIIALIAYMQRLGTDIKNKEGE
jgi:cytochrome c oxidase cbb3-type subunit I/II